MQNYKFYSRSWKLNRFDFTWRTSSLWWLIQFDIYNMLVEQSVSYKTIALKTTGIILYNFLLVEENAIRTFDTWRSSISINTFILQCCWDLLVDWDIIHFRQILTIVSTNISKQMQVFLGYVLVMKLNILVLLSSDVRSKTNFLAAS